MFRARSSTEIRVFQMTKLNQMQLTDNLTSRAEGASPNLNDVVSWCPYITW
jgi:hypothetical protein